MSGVQAHVFFYFVVFLYFLLKDFFFPFKAADREAGDELEFIRCQLREREDDIFASDEKITQLECELEEVSVC